MSHQRRLTRTRLVLAVAVIAIAGGIGVAIGIAGGDQPRPAFDSVSNRGIEAPSAVQRAATAIRRDGVVSVLGTVNGRTFYRIDSNDRSMCYAVGPSASTTIGQARCSPTFPSAQNPIADFSVYRARLTDTYEIVDAQVVRSEGIAADGIASVGYMNAAGETVTTTPVRRNLYSFDAVPDGMALIVGRDSEKHVVFSRPISREGAAFKR
jgi:hypothetical protein